MKMRGVVVDQHVVGSDETMPQTVRVEIKLKGENQNLQLGPMLNDAMVYVSCTPEQAKEFPTGFVFYGELHARKGA